MPGKSPIFIIMYRDLIRDPVHWMRRTYDYYGIEWTDNTQRSEYNASLLVTAFCFERVRKVKQDNLIHRTCGLFCFRPGTLLGERPQEKEIREAQIHPGGVWTHQRDAQRRVQRVLRVLQDKNGQCNLRDSHRFFRTNQHGTVCPFSGEGRCARTDLVKRVTFDSYE